MVSIAANDDELRKALVEDEVEIEQEHADQEALFREVAEVYEIYKKRLSDPAFQAYQRQVVERATRLPENLPPAQDTSETTD